jgi:arylformamidase
MTINQTLRGLLLTLTIHAAVCAYGEEEVLITRDIHYGSDPLQTVDVYATNYCKLNTCPVVMWVHGGGWKRGDTGGTSSTDMQTLWARQGIVMVGVNYRLTPDVQHPALVQDIAAAFNWTTSNIAQYGGDKRRISLLGHSAGAHLVALVATDPRYLAAYGLKISTDIRDVFPIDTASFDLTDKSSVFVSALVKDAFGTDPAVLNDASPIWQVNAKGAYPPFLIAATSARPDAINTSQTLQAKLRSANDSADVMVMDYGNAGQLQAHGLIAEDLANLDSAMTKALLRRVTTPAIDTEVLMDWAQMSYPQLFPGPQTSITAPPYVYRHYPTTGNYLGVSGKTVYVFGLVSPNATSPQAVGQFDDFKCRIYPGDCD